MVNRIEHSNGQSKPANGLYVVNKPPKDEPTNPYVAPVLFLFWMAAFCISAWLVAWVVGAWREALQ